MIGKLEYPSQRERRYSYRKRRAVITAGKHFRYSLFCVFCGILKLLNDFESKQEK